MRAKSNSGHRYLVTGIDESDVQRQVRDAYLEKYLSDIDRSLNPQGNVVGGSLDGATMPNGTRDGQQYRWDAESRRWVHV